MFDFSCGAVSHDVLASDVCTAMQNALSVAVEAIAAGVAVLGCTLHAFLVHTIHLHVYLSLSVASTVQFALEFEVCVHSLPKLL